MNFGSVWTLIIALITYVFLVFALPGICLGKYIKKKGLVFRFFFYQCVGNLYIGFIVLFLGYLKVFNITTAYLLIVVLPLCYVCIRERNFLTKKWKSLYETLYELVTGTYGVKVFFKNNYVSIKGKVYTFKEKYVSRNKIELLVLFGVLFWLVWFYGWYKLHNVAYSHTDEETHLYWIIELMNGNMFPAGMYPHGMHTLVATISILTGLTVTRVNHIFCILSVALIYLGAYLMFRKMFSHVYVALVGWVAVALLDVFDVIAYFRFQTSFPMEFGLIAAFGMIYAMFAFLKSKDRIYMVLFALSISWTMMAHFYITILCAVICLCFGMVYGFYLFKKKLLISFICSGVIGIVISVIPYGVGLINGYTFERSIEWALGITQTSQKDEVEAVEENVVIEELSLEELEEFWLKKELIDNIKEPFSEEIRERWAALEVYLTENYAKNRTVSRAFIFTCITIELFSVIGLCVKKEREIAARWLFFMTFWLVGAVMACSYYMDVFVLIEVKRMATFLMFFTIPMMGYGMEVLCRILGAVKKINITYIGAAIVLMELALIFITENERKERYYQIAMAEGDMLVCLDLVENKEPFTWTMISTTNDLSVVRYDGYHYEIIDLIKELDEGKEHIYIPTPEIYVALEEKVISFRDVVREIDRSDVTLPGKCTDISSELALMEIDYELDSEDNLHGADAPYYFQREQVMSKLYYWVEAMKEVYASHVEEYYRDEQMVVYKIKQDPYFLLNLSLDYKSIAEQQRESVE